MTDYFLKFDTEEEAISFLQERFSKPLMSVNEYHYGDGFVMKRVQVPIFEQQVIDGQNENVFIGYEPGVHINLRTEEPLSNEPIAYMINPITPIEVFS